MTSEQNPQHLVATVDSEANALFICPQEEAHTGKESHEHSHIPISSTTIMPDRLERKVSSQDDSSILCNPWDGGIENFLNLKDRLVVPQPEISPGNSSSGVSSMGDSYLVEPGPASGDSCLSAFETDRLKDVDEAIEADLNSHSLQPAHPVNHQAHLGSSVTTESSYIHPYYVSVNMANKQERTNPLPPTGNFQNIRHPLCHDNTTTLRAEEKLQDRILTSVPDRYASWQPPVSSFPPSNMSTPLASPIPFWTNLPYAKEANPLLFAPAQATSSIKHPGSLVQENNNYRNIPYSITSPHPLIANSLTHTGEQKPLDQESHDMGNKLSSVKREASFSKVGPLKREASPLKSCEDQPSLKRRQHEATYSVSGQSAGLAQSDLPSKQSKVVNESTPPPPPYHVIVARAILSSSSGKMILSDIYTYAVENYPQLLTSKCAWRNSIRHSLSVNNCFIKKERAPNGRGYYWAIHPTVLEDFKKGDCNKRMVKKRAQPKERYADSLPKLPPIPLSVSQEHQTPTGPVNREGHAIQPTGSIWPTKVYGTSPWYFPPVSYGSHGLLAGYGGSHESNVTYDTAIWPDRIVPSYAQNSFTHSDYL